MQSFEVNVLSSVSLIFSVTFKVLFVAEMFIKDECFELIEEEVVVSVLC